jgi:putative heme transporter
VKTAMHWALVAAALGYTGYKAPPLFSAAGQEFDRLDQLRWAWIVAALALGLGAVALYGEIHRRLLVVGGARLSWRTVQSITFAENAVAVTVPVVGGAGAIAYAISRFHRRGADTDVAAWAVLLSGAVAALSLAGMTAVALAAIGRLPAVLAGVLVVAVVGAGVGAWSLVTHPVVLRRVVRPVLHLAARVPGRCPTCRARRLATLESGVDGVAARLGRLRPSGGQWFALVVVSCLTYVLDFASLATASAAVLPAVPWSALVWGYLLVQGSIALQVLPGGAGLAEVGLIGALLAAGVAAAPAAGVVLIYRIASWLLPAAVGWVMYAAQIHVLRPLPHKHLQPAAV